MKCIVIYTGRIIVAYIAAVSGEIIAKTVSILTDYKNYNILNSAAFFGSRS